MHRLFLNLLLFALHSLYLNRLLGEVLQAIAVDLLTWRRDAPSYDWSDFLTIYRIEGLKCGR